MKTKVTRSIDIAHGNIQAELVIKNAKIINVFSHEIIEAD